MRTSRLLPVLLATAGGLSACTANIHDNTIPIDIPNATINLTSSPDVSDVMPGQTVPMTVDVKNVYLIDPSMTPPAADADTAGHLQVYLDDTSTPPLIVTAQTTIMVPIPENTKAGPHKLICRVHKHDGTPTSTMFELDITVKVTVTTSPDGATTVDSSTTIEAGTVTTTDAAASGN